MRPSPLPWARPPVLVCTVALTTWIGLATTTNAGDPPTAGPRYVLTDLGTLGGDFSQAYAINDFGEVVGWSTTTDAPRAQRHAFVWRDGVMFDLGTPGGVWSEARAINNIGQIVGTGTNAAGEQHAFLSYDGIVFDLNDIVYTGVLPDPGRDAMPMPPARQLPTPPSNPPACSAPLDVILEANAINDDGLIVGCGYLQADEAVHGLLFLPVEPFFPTDPSYTYVDLGTLKGAAECVALGINDDGVVVGMSGQRAFVYADGVIEQLATLGAESMAATIANNGFAVGWTGASSMQPQACVWTDQLRVDLGAPKRWISEARDLNQSGDVVGWMAEDMGQPRQAVVWQDGWPIVLTDVTAIPLRPMTFLWSRLEDASAIDARGRIVGHGRSIDGLPRAFLLTPFDFPGYPPTTTTALSPKY